MTLGKKMLSTLRNIFSPKRCQARRQIKAMFGPYVSTELVEQMIEEGSSLHTMRSRREKIRVIAFFYPGWGFSDSALPKLRAILEDIDAPVDVSHSRLTVCFYGEGTEKEFNRVRMLLEATSTEPDFSGFKVGVAEGYSESFTDVGRITAEAFHNEKEDGA